MDIELLNNIIREAVYYGGDSGGPYCSYPDDLIEAMELYIGEEPNITVEVLRDENHCPIPQFVKVQ